MARTSDVKPSQNTLVLMYHYVGFHEAAESFSGTKSRMLLHSSKGCKLQFAHDDCIMKSNQEPVLSWHSSPSPEGPLYSTQQISGIKPC